MSFEAVACFLAVVAVTLGVTAWASRRAIDPSTLYTAGGRISAPQNGMAITGDFISAAAIFGSVALFHGTGVGMTIYFIAPLVGLCLLLALMAGPLRALGRYTVGDVLVARLDDDNVRTFAGISTIVLSEMYMVAQLVAGGTLFSVLLDIPFAFSVAGVGILVVVYVCVGGMLATTWVQIIKAGLLIAGVMLMGALSLGAAGGLGALHARAEAAMGGGLDDFTSMGASTFSSLSLGAGLVFGMMGMPHLLVRFLTVPDVAAARRSALFASILVALVLGMLLLLIGPATLAFVKDVPAYESAPGVMRGGTNMAFIHLASAMGGELLFGAITAVAFSTILAVVSGLGVAIASTVSHDIARPLAESRGGTFGEKREVRWFRVSAAVAATVAVLIALALQHENIAFLSALAYGIAASTNFPVLVLALYWPRLTAAGAIAGGCSGLVLSVALLIAGPTVWQKILGNPAPLFPSDYSALVAIPVAFLVAITVSLGRPRTRPAHLAAG